MSEHRMAETPHATPATRKGSIVQTAFFNPEDQRVYVVVCGRDYDEMYRAVMSNWHDPRWERVPLPGEKDG